MTELGQREWLNQPQLAEWLGVDVRTIFNWRLQGRLPFHKFGGKILFHGPTIRNLLAPYLKPEPDEPAVDKQAE